MRTFFLLTFFISLSLNSYSQNFIKGKLIDQLFGNKLDSVEITIEGNKIFSDINGKFSYTPEKVPVEVYITDIRYYSKRILIDNNDERIINITNKGIVLDDIIVNSELFSNKLKNISLSTSVIDDINLRKETNEFIISSLNEVAGVYIHSAGYNTNRITIRGMGSRSPYSTNKIKGYLNNIPLSNGIGEISLEDFSIHMIDHIEIVKGPNSSLYGSGLGGNILFKTNKGNSNFINYTSSIKSFNTYQNSFSLSKNIGDLGLFLSIEKIKSDGYRENNTYDNNRGLLNIKYQFNERFNFEFIQFFTDAKALIPSSLSLSNYLENPSSAALSWKNVKGGEDYKRTLSGLTFNLNIPSIYNKSTSIYFKSFVNDELRPFNYLDEDSKIFGLRHYGKFNLSNSNLIYGIDYSHEDYIFNTWDNYGEIDEALINRQVQNRNNYNFFVQYNQIIKDYSKIILGVSSNNIQYKWTCCDENQNINLNYDHKNVISPRISYSYKKNNKSYFINISHGYSAPNIDETLDDNGLVNPGIRPETGWNYELGFVGSSRNTKISYNINAYYMDIKNLLIAQRTDFDTFTGVNAGKTSHPGIEGKINLVLFNNTNLFIRSSNNFSKYWYSFRDFNNRGIDYSKNKLTGVPSHSINSKIIIEYRNFIGQFSIENVGKIPITDSNEIYSDSFSKIDLKLSKKIISGPININFSTGINNLLNKKHASGIVINARGFGGRDPRYFYPGLPRNYYIAINLSI